MTMFTFITYILLCTLSTVILINATNLIDVGLSGAHTAQDSLGAGAHTAQNSLGAGAHTAHNSLAAGAHTAQDSLGAGAHTAEKAPGGTHQAGKAAAAGVHKAEKHLSDGMGAAIGALDGGVDLKLNAAEGGIDLKGKGVKLDLDLDGGNILEEDKSDLSEECSKLDVVSRKSWGAKNPVPQIDRLKRITQPWLMVHHTAGDPCTTTEACKKEVKEIEKYEMEKQNAKEILAHFLIGGDGKIYEGRGWFYPDEHIPGLPLYLSVSFIGSYFEVNATETMLATFRKLVACFRRKVAGFCERVFSVHSDHRCTQCPGANLKNQLTQMPNYDNSKNTRPCERHASYVAKFIALHKEDLHRDSYEYDPAEFSYRGDK